MADPDRLDYFLAGVLSQDPKRRLEVSEDLVSYLRNKETSLYCEEMDKFADGLASWVNSSNFKVVSSLPFSSQKSVHLGHKHFHNLLFHAVHFLLVPPISSPYIFRLSPDSMTSSNPCRSDAVTGLSLGIAILTPFPAH